LRLVPDETGIVDVGFFVPLNIVKPLNKAAQTRFFALAYLRAKGNNL